MVTTSYQLFFQENKNGDDKIRIPKTSKVD